MFADVSGFTPLVESLSRQGERGPEEVQRIVNFCFGRLTAAVEEAGGDLLCFAGDAALALWPAESPAALGAAVARAAQCALAIQRRLDGSDLEGGHSLRLRIALGAGALQIASLGGVDGRWQVLATGAPLEQVAQALRGTRPGDVTLAPEAVAAARDQLLGAEVAGGGLRLERLLTLAAPAASFTACGNSAGLRPYVPRAVQARLDAGLHEWLGEFRRVSVLFANFAAAAGDALDALQPAIAAMQEAVYRYGGSVNQVVADEKGITLVAAWGVAQHAHEDAPVRAVLAALALERRLAELGLAVRVGVATDRVFAGLRGHPSRLEFGLMGDGVNLAARLAQAARPILCDAATRAAARERVVFESLPPVHLKGKAEPVDAYRPRATRAATTSGAVPVGRAAELAVLEERLLALEHGGRGGAILIEGEPGIGKSRLLRHLVERAQELGVRALVGAGDAIERSAAYHAWRPVVARLLAGMRGGDAAALVDRLQHLAGDEALDGDLLALLNPLLPLALAESATTRDMAARSRGEGARELMVRILRGVAARGPTLLVIEDAHWLDSASRELVEAVAQRVSPLLLVVGTRPQGADERSWSALLGQPGAAHLRLDVLSPAESLALVCRRLDVDLVPEEVARFVHERAGGHPLFVEELTYALRDRGLLRVEGGECRLAGDDSALASTQLPATVQGVVGSRIDALSPREQLTLKVASVFGQRFEVEALRAVHPLAAERDSLDEQLDAMVRAQLVQPEAAGARRAFLFKHVILQEIAYGLLPYAQRRPLHRGVALWYEQAQAREVSSLYPLLAHHWRHAEEKAKALEYLEKAGRHALHALYANREAERFFGELLELADEMQAEASASAGAERVERRSRWERELGEAIANQGRPADAVRVFEGALARLGDPPPATPRRLVARLLARVGRQVLHRALRAPRPLRADDGARPAELEAVRAYARLGACYYVLDRYPPALYALISGLNRAERLGPTSELALAYADAGNAVGMVPLHRLARTYGALARATAERVDSPSTTAIVLSRSSIYRTVVADWSAIEDLERARQISARLGNHFQWEETTYVLVRLLFFRGDLEEACGLAVALDARARESGARVHRVWAIEAHAECLLRLGALDEAIEQAQCALQLAEEGGPAERHVQGGAQGILASAWSRKGDVARALAAAETALGAAQRSSGTGYNFSATIGVAEGSLAAADGGALSARAAELAAQACKLLRTYARRVPIAEPAAHYWQGRFDWALGRTTAAARAWTASLEAAERMGLRYDAAQAHGEIGRHLPAGDPSRQRHLETAAAVFAEIGAAWDAARARA